jgi:hypothetical protein
MEMHNPAHHQPLDGVRVAVAVVDPLDETPRPKPDPPP